MFSRVFIFAVVLLSATSSFATSWEGRWEYGRYTQSIGGALTIKDCTDTKCQFELFTSHGSHSCSASGTITIKGNNGRYFERLRFYGNQELLFGLDPKKRIINVTYVDGDFCGMRGYLEGAYEHASLPYRYETSFDCWAENLTNAEKTVCASSDLAKADLEFSKNYPKAKTSKWLESRNQCEADEKCLWNFYKISLLNAYSEANHKKFNFYDYIKNQKQTWHYPTDLLLLNDFLQKGMEKGYYGAWRVSLGDDAYDKECENCIFRHYGIAGFYKTYESAIYVDKNDVWVVFISANLPEPEDKNIIVFAPKDKLLDDMPKNIKNFTDNLVKSGVFQKDSIKLLKFKEPSIKEKIMNFIASVL